MKRSVITRALGCELNHRNTATGKHSRNEGQEIIWNIHFEMSTLLTYIVVNEIALRLENSGTTQVNHGNKAKGLSQLEFFPSTPTINLKSRRITILVADGFDGTVVQGLRAAIKVAGAFSFVIAPRRVQIKASTGAMTVQADHHFEGQRSTMRPSLLLVRRV